MVRVVCTTTMVFETVVTLMHVRKVVTGNKEILLREKRMYQELIENRGVGLKFRMKPVKDEVFSRG